MLALPLAFPFGAAGDDWKKSGDEDCTFWRAPWGVPCTDAGRDRRGAGEDIFHRWFVGEELQRSRLSESNPLPHGRDFTRKVERVRSYFADFQP